MGKVESSDRFICDVCGKLYSKQFNLNQHLQSVHSTYLFECAHCSFKSGRKFVLQRHIFSHHFRPLTVAKSKQEHEKKKVYHAKKCSKERNLPTQKFECTLCEKSFTFKSNLTRHMTFLHGNNIEDRSHKCAHCSKAFQDKSKVKRHLKVCEGRLKVDQSLKGQTVFTCVISECEAVFNDKYSIMKHYEEVHAVPFQYESLEFESKEQFNEWRVNLQRNTACQFAVSIVWERQTFRNWRMLCHRTGLQPAEKENRKRFPKTSGSKKLNGFCPAEIVVKENKTDKTCHVVIQKTHVGHSNTFQEELKFLRLYKKEKDDVTSKSPLAIPLNTVLMNYQTSSSVGPELLQQYSIINYDDVANITITTELNTTHLAPLTDGPREVMNFIDEHQESILFYKEENSDDVEFGVLKAKDFALVYMSKFQEDLLKKFSHNIIAYVIHKTNANDLSLHSIMVLDDNCEGVAVAFLLSNRNDTTVLELFLHCIRKRTGVLAPLTILTDMQASFHNAFEVVMQAPQFDLWCTWHMYERWRKNLSKIENSEKKKIVMIMLYKLSKMTDVQLFEAELMKFLCHNDPDLQLFIQYFKENYAENTRHWADCYRIGVKIDTNMINELFHSFSQTVICEKKNFKTVYECLRSIELYISIRENSIKAMCVRPQRTQKVRSLRTRHHIAVKSRGFFTIHTVDSETDECSHTWLVSSFEKVPNKKGKSQRKENECSSNDETDIEDPDNRKETATKDEYNLQLYIVERHINFERKSIPSIECSLCKVSFEEYSCTCMDYLLKCNICKHIHAVVQYCKENNCQCNCEPTSDGIEFYDIHIEENSTAIYTNVSEYVDNLVEEWDNNGEDCPIEDTNDGEESPEDLKIRLANEINNINDLERLRDILRFVLSNSRSVSPKEES